MFAQHFIHRARCRYNQVQTIRLAQACKTSLAIDVCVGIKQKRALPGRIYSDLTFTHVADARIILLWMYPRHVGQSHTYNNVTHGSHLGKEFRANSIMCLC